MAHHPLPSLDGVSPFGKIDGLDRGDFREAAYEVFFTACRASPGFGGRSAIAYHNNGYEEAGDGPGSPRRPGVGMAVTSRVKRALGLKMLRRSTSRRSNSCGSNPSSPGSAGSPRVSPSAAGVRRRPMTSAEIMRQQMWVTEQSDNRLRKTLMRTLVGQMGRRAETIILPLELLRHLKPSEFADAEEYHQWQKRQLKVLEAGLLLFPSIPLDKSDPSAEKLSAIIRSAEEGRPIDTGKNSETMRALCSSVVSLAWRSSDDVCHWADGYPLNAEIYKTLLESIFDIRDETLVLDEVDELLELMKKTWSTLGIDKATHNVLFTWVLFEQYVATGQAEGDLLAASLTMLTEVANDAKKAEREAGYMRMLAELLTAMKKWCEIRLVDYHGNFDVGSVGLMESILPLVFSAAKILEEDVPSYITPHHDKGEMDYDSTGNKVDCYIRSSSKNAFAKMVEEQNAANMDRDRVSEMMIKLARETEQLASKEKAIFSPVMKKWHPIAAGVSAVTLHTCYGVLLRQYINGGAAAHMSEAILVLQRAGKLEKALVQMVVEDSVECEDGGKAIVREMVPYEADTIIVRLLKQWMQEKLKVGKDKLQRAKETETWNPKSKSEPYSHSAEEIVKFCKETIENFFEIPINVSESLVYELTDGLEHLLGEYITFVASCGSKQSYLPTLPPLTRCSKDSKFIKLWKKAACSVGTEQQDAAAAAASQTSTAEEGNNHPPRPSTSRGTQRLYIRLNTLHYLLKHLHSLEKTLSLSPKVTPSKSRRFGGSRRQLGGSYFDHSRSAIEAASQHVAEVAAYRLVFLDSSSVMYGGLYSPDVAGARVKAALRVMKQNLTLLCAIVTEHVQAAALRHVMAACFEAYIMVLLAGGSSRIFARADHAMIEEDFEGLKRLFGEGEEVEAEAEAVEGVVALMGETTEQLVEDFSILVCEAGATTGAGTGAGAGAKLPMPPTTGKWSRTDPNTILRVLCHRNDRAANSFLKRTFHLAKRNGSL
ncbi:protein unc-13 homolog [Salvia miltiorrhiza]|uniref:protein unc-13 homolog n=1 Tax=Salvia miltiorrhiza TaxID=226208 RepID=UPI0025ABA2F5|nr:protein unc-13 homolog [Salvia miltiorrhiza]